MSRRLEKLKLTLIRAIEEQYNTPYINNATRIADHRDAVDYILTHYRLVKRK